MAVRVDRVDGVVAEPVARNIVLPQAADRGAKTLGYVAWAAILGAIVGFNELAIEQLQAGDGRDLGRENGPLETAQLFAVVPALALFWLAGLKGRGAVRVGPGRSWRWSACWLSSARSTSRA